MSLTAQKREPLPDLDSGVLQHWYTRERHELEVFALAQLLRRELLKGHVNSFTTVTVLRRLSKMRADGRHTVVIILRGVIYGMHLMCFHGRDARPNAETAQDSMLRHGLLPELIDIALDPVASPRVKRYTAQLLNAFADRGKIQ